MVLIFCVAKEFLNSAVCWTATVEIILIFIPVHVADDHVFASLSVGISG